MNPGFFTDNDFAKFSGFTTSRAVVRHVSADIHIRVYTASDLAEDRDHFFATAAPGIRVPFSSDRRR
jgi:hypothetical protein